MADVKITDLATGTIPVSGNVIPIVQSGTTNKIDPSLYYPSYTISKVSGTDFTSTSTTLVDITGLSYAASASSLYWVEIMLIGQCTSTAGLVTSVAYSAAGATGTWNAVGSLAATTMTTVGNALGTAGGSGFWTTATTDETIRMWAFVKTGANAGNITAQIKKNTSGTATIYIGSTMIVWQRN